MAGNAVQRLKKVGLRTEMEKYFARVVLLIEISGSKSEESLNW